MNKEIKTLLRNDTIMFEYDVHDMHRAVQWYQDIFGFEVVYGPTHCHTEFALPLTGARLACVRGRAGFVDETERIRIKKSCFRSTPFSLCRKVKKVLQTP